mgnify:CR=1 FL=1
MPKSVIIPAGSSAPLAPFVPGTLADGVALLRRLHDAQVSPVRWLLINIITCCLPMTQRRKPATFWKLSAR